MFYRVFYKAVTKGASRGYGTDLIMGSASASVGQWTYDTVLSGGTSAHEKLLTNNLTDPLGN
jgi:hypothetical protein